MSLQHGIEYRPDVRRVTNTNNIDSDTREQKLIRNSHKIFVDLQLPLTVKNCHKYTNHHLVAR